MQALRATIWTGPSLLTGETISVYVLSESTNGKTGNMVQTYIMRADQEPHQAVKTGADEAVCGQCPRRPALGGDCYVLVFQGPLGVHRAAQRGNYPAMSPEDAGKALAGRRIRLGTYGDPAAVPAHVWAQLVAHADAWTGYTHQWRSMLGTERAAQYRQFLMASCDTPQDREDAMLAGWRTFRVRDPHQPIMPGEFMCPASEEAGKRRTCETCRACSGVAPDRVMQASPVIIAHGQKSKRRTVSIRPA